ncbi:hypothetical protein Tco_0333093 [Tanacetum coccineum]
MSWVIKVLAKVGKVAYRLELPQELSRVHHTFHVSNLKKCYADEPLVMPLEGIHVDDKLQFVEEPVEIMEREIKRLKRSRIPLVKVRWNSRRGPEFTWEREDSDIVLGYDGLPLQPVAPPSPDYIPGPENPQTPPVPQDEDEREPMFVQAHDPDYVPEPIYPEYIPLEDDHEFPAEEQPLPPGYEDDETEDGPVDYPMDGGDDGDDDDGDSSRDDARDEDEDEEDEEDEEEEEHLAPADSTTVIPADEPVFPLEGTEPVIPPPSTDITIGARISVRPQISISLPPEAEIERLLTMTTPIHHPPPNSLPKLLFKGSALLLTTAPPANFPPTATIPIHTTPYSRYEIGESSTARPTRGRGIDYGFASTVDVEESSRDTPYALLGEVNTKVVELAELHERDTQDLYALLEDAQDSRSRISQASLKGTHTKRVDLLWGIGYSQDTETHQELQTHRDHVYEHETHLQAHQTQLQLQSTLIQTQHQVHETRFQMQHAELASLRETDRKAPQPDGRDSLSH